MRPVAPLDLLAEGLTDLTRYLESAPPADAHVAEEVRRLAALASGMGDYVERSTSPESPALAALDDRTRGHDWGDGTLEAEMLSGHVEGEFLAFLVRATGARRVLELGMFTGYSALAMAEALPEDGDVVACEIDAAVAALARELLDASPAGRRVAIRVGPGAETLRELGAEGAAFDLIFIDAEKPGYVGYYEQILASGLLAPGGIVCVDNTLMQGEPWLDGPRSANGEAIARFNAVVAADDRVRQVLVPLRDGLTLLQRA